MRSTKGSFAAAWRLPALAALLLLPGCTVSKLTQTQGYVVDETLVASIQPGVDNRESVEKTLGRPTWASEFDRSSWYYVSRNSEQLAFLTPKPIAQSVIIISFNDAGGVTKVERDGLDKVISVKMSGDKTPTLGRETGII
ncbi:MAG: outer membrane protein assembly factor BamE, partial [Polymorphobacter sp.]